MLPASGPISTNDIMNELGLPIQQREWSTMWAAAAAGTIPKAKADAGGPYVLPNDWWNYQNAVYGGTLLLDIPGVGNNIPPDCPGCSIRSGYTLGGGITIKNTHATETVLFKTASLLEPYPIIVSQGPARLLNHTANPSVVFYTTPSDGEIITPGSFVTHLAFSKTAGGGIAVLSLETQTNAGGRQQFFWSFNV